MFHRSAGRHEMQIFRVSIKVRTIPWPDEGRRKKKVNEKDKVDGKRRELPLIVSNKSGFPSAPRRLRLAFTAFRTIFSVNVVYVAAVGACVCVDTVS